jgi:TetR/AcrR family transcriptional regulator, tetracycline repressor protein
MSTAERLPLSRDRIISVAVELVDRHGLDALSMRKLGAALGVEAMSLYNHVENKDDVLDGMLDLVMCQIRIPGPASPWDDRLRALANEIRRAGLEHPGVLPLFGTRPIATAEGFAPVEAIHEILVQAGFATERGVHAVVYVAAFVLGYLRIDLGRLAPPPGDPSGPYVTWVGPEHERAAQFGQSLVAQDWDEEFEQCLDLVIESLRALIGDPAGVGE